MSTATVMAKWGRGGEQWFEKMRHQRGEERGLSLQEKENFEQATHASYG